MYSILCLIIEKTFRKKSNVLIVSYLDLPILYIQTYIHTYTLFLELKKNLEEHDKK